MPAHAYLRRFGLTFLIFIASLTGFFAALSPALAQTAQSMPPIGYVGPWPPPAGIMQQAPAAAPAPSTAPAQPASAAVPQKQKLAGAKTTAAAPQPEDQTKETLITAEHMASDQETGILTASGHVEIARSGYILHADKVTYNQNTGVMRAEGHVAMLTPSGEVQFSNSEEVTGDMKQAFAENVGILFTDNSRMAARVSQRYEGRYTVADTGMYTSCNVCADDPDHPPLWQLRSKEIVHDNTEHELYYHDTTIDFGGLPLLYTPYMSGPDPTVDRRQGFLTPTPGFNPNIGGYVKVPYYFDIAPETDAVLAPTFSQTDGLQMAGEIRHRFENGNMQFDGSFTHADLISDAGIDEGQQWRGHLFGSMLFNLDDTWRAGTDVAFASDKSYLERYQIGSEQQLTNRVYAEGFSGRNYAVVNSYYFEDLQPGTQPVQPLVLPSANFNLLGEPGQTLGGRWNADGNMLVTSRDNSLQGLNQQGPDTRRVSLDAGWERRLISDTGLETTAGGFVRGDAYSADNVINPNNSQIYNNVMFARQFEQASIVSAYPLGRNGDGYQQLLEPLVSVVAAPSVYNSSKQPIEDSVDVQFDETNLFSPNRFTGYDLIEGGSRVVYGLRHAITTDSGGRVDMFGGQSYDFSKNDSFPGLSGLRDQASDYVGRIEFVPTEWLDFNYGFRLDHDTFSPQRQDARISIGAPVFRPYIRYISAYETQTTGTASNIGLITDDTVTNVEQATIGEDSIFSKYWHFHAEHTQAFSPQPGPRSSSMTLNYIDECLIFGFSLSHDDTQRADISSGTSAVFHIFLKNLGGIRSDSATANYPTEFRQAE